ncbi:hypothetical protein P0Y35_11730 [Kiritimatiellaeota bacterium B1221]|nr:hypothetical protein [Kiritimatiellaeota bacterium B1221]
MLIEYKDKVLELDNSFKKGNLLILELDAKVGEVLLLDKHKYKVIKKIKEGLLVDYEG